MRLSVVFPLIDMQEERAALQMKEWSVFLFSLNASLLTLGIPAGPSLSSSHERMYLKFKQTPSTSQINWSSFLLSKQKPPK